MKYYVPLCLQSPLLIHTAMYTAACFLNETSHLDNSVTMAHKSQAISMLNENLCSDSCSSDETVAAHSQLILNEWYWGAATDLSAHLRGLKDIISLRGGFRSLGLHGLIAKMAITADVAIALSCEIPPALQPIRQIEPLENTQVPLRLTLNTPLVSSLPRFADCAEALKLDPATAAILDDMRFLISAVLALPDNPSPKELQKINTTASWIHNRTSSLPDYSPCRPSPAARSSTTPAIIVTDNSAFDLTPETDQSSTLFSRRGSWHSVHSTHSITSGTSSRSDQADQAYSDQDSPIPFPLPQPSQPQSQRLEPSPSPPTPTPPDPLYTSIRLAAILYSRAIMTRQPFSAVISSSEFSALWGSIWHVPLTAWKGVLGVFNWIIVALAPAAGARGEGGRRQKRFVRSMLANSLLQMGSDNWELARGVMEGGGRLQGWLGQGGREEDGVMG
ncbi:hypothetical protein GE09DRAFT_582522 [Coniochaeta sp. 2T2.1]|nr:hypothetical protein GE09DRAFT_582522 [Coniochaeta sp. 2T2.1]